MNPHPFPFEDFRRAKHRLLGAVLEHQEPFALLTGETGTGKTALLRELRTELDRARHRVVYFSEARKLGAAGLVKVLAESLRVRASMCHALSLDYGQRHHAELAAAGRVAGALGVVEHKVLPLSLESGEPVADPKMDSPRETPSYLRGYRRGRQGDAQG